jgi:hypothetical protein
MRAPAASAKSSAGKPGFVARIKRALGINPAPCGVVHHFEDIKSLSNAQPAVRAHERVELPLVTHNKLTGTW